MKRTLLILALLVGACGEAGATDDVTSTTTITVPVPDEPFVVLVTQYTGGCEMMGPNCPVYVVWSDGLVQLYRTAPPEEVFGPRIKAEGVEASANIDPAGVAALEEIVMLLDFDELRARLEPGVAQAPFDGIDVTAAFGTRNGPETLDSVTYDFSADEPIFAAFGAVMSAAQDVLSFPLATHG
jgi:hypothetical protein